MAVKRLAYVIPENGDCNVPKLWTAFESNQELQSLRLTTHRTISDENAQLFDAWCRYFGFKLKSLEIESWPPIDRAIDPKSFDNLTTFIAVHEYNHPVSKMFLSYLCNFSPAISKLCIRCEAEALPVIGSFTCLKHLNISLVVPWYLTGDSLNDWAEANVVNDLAEQFNKLTSKLETFVIYARHIRVPWSIMNLSHLIELDVDTGQFRQLLCLTHCQQLQKLTYSYYGTEFCVSEIDDWEVLMEHLHKLSSVRFRISNHFKDRVEAINWIASFAEDWPNTLFKVDDYWNEDFAPGTSNTESDQSLAQDGNVVYQTRSKTAENGTAISVIRSENVLVKVSLEERKHFEKFKKQTSW